MKKIVAIAMLVFVGYAGTAASNDYFINDLEVEQVLNQGELLDLNSSEFDLENSLDVTSVQAGDQSMIVALILDFFLGGIAIHRVYLGGKGGLVLIYFITCGGIFGVVPLVDFFVIAFGGMDKFIDNDKFIAW